MNVKNKFWEVKKLKDFSDAEWEAVCLKCGWCCVSKCSIPDTEELFFTNAMCEKFDFSTGRCSCYDTRLQTGTCLKVNLELIQTLPEILPEFCAYRLLFEGKPLPPYHPLISGDEQSPHKEEVTALEYTGFVNISELQEALDRVEQQSLEKHWDMETIEHEVEKVYNKYPIKCLFTSEKPA